MQRRIRIRKERSASWKLACYYNNKNNSSQLLTVYNKKLKKKHFVKI